MGSYKKFYTKMDLFYFFRTEPEFRGVSAYLPYPLASLLSTRLCYDVETILIVVVILALALWLNRKFQQIVGFQWSIVAEDLADGIREFFHSSWKWLREEKSDMVLNVLSPRPASAPLRHPPGTHERLLKDLAHKRHIASLKMRALYSIKCGARKQIEEDAMKLKTCKK